MKSAPHRGRMHRYGAFKEHRGAWENEKQILFPGFIDIRCGSRHEMGGARNDAS
jgi:hypothetical protein